MSAYRRREINKWLLAGMSLLATPSLTGSVAANIAKVEPLENLAFSSWCFHRPLWRGEMKAWSLPALARSMDIDTLEWTAKTLRNLRDGRDRMYQAPPSTFFEKLRKAADDSGVHSQVLNVGGPFFLASADRDTQLKAVEFVLQYIEPAKILGCNILRTELYFDGEHKPGWKTEARKHAVEGLQILLEKTRESGLVINIENHHGISSQPDWLVSIFEAVNSPRLGLTVDTNNFRIDQDNPYDRDMDSLPQYVDRYTAIEKLMPLANWISAKFYAFDSTGYEIALDYPRIIDIIINSRYSGHISVEYEGTGDPTEGLRSSLAMLRNMRRHYSLAQSSC